MSFKYCIKQSWNEDRRNEWEAGKEFDKIPSKSTQMSISLADPHLSFCFTYFLFWKKTHKGEYFPFSVWPSTQQMEPHTHLQNKQWSTSADLYITVSPVIGLHVGMWQNASQWGTRKNCCDGLCLQFQHLEGRDRKIRSSMSPWAVGESASNKTKSKQNKNQEMNKWNKTNKNPL